MYTQSYDDAGRDSSASTAETGSNFSTWRHLPSEAKGETATPPPAYEENLQTVLEDSERHLDALWNMLNSQMSRLSNGYTPTTEAQSLSLSPVSEWVERSGGEQSEASNVSENGFEQSQAAAAFPPLAAASEVVTADSETESSAEDAMPFNFVPVSVPSLVVSEESEELPAEEAQLNAVESSISELATEEEPTAVFDAEAASVSSPTDEIDAPVSTLHEPEPETTEPEAVVMPAALAVSASAAEPDANEVSAQIEPIPAVEVPQASPYTVPVPFPAVRVESAFRENWLVVTAREAGSVTVLPTVTMRIQSQPNQSLQMRSTAIGEMPTSITPLVTVESTEEAGSEPSTMRVEIAYTSDAPDMVFEVNSQSEDEVQITLSDQSGDLCASWEASKQKGKYACAKATLSRYAGDPEVLIEVQRFREDAAPTVWRSLLSFSVVPK